MKNNKELENELWRNITETDKKYQVSNFGKVRKVEKNGDLKLLNQYNLKGNRLYVSLYFNKKKHTKSVHRLVASEFLLKPKKINYEINHIDGNYLNNKSSNLEWCSHKYNMEHAKLNNLLCIGLKSKFSKFSREEIINIRNLNKNGYKFKDIKSLYPNCNKVTLWKIIANRSYRDVIA